jgi:hypothetical protein
MIHKEGHEQSRDAVEYQKKAGSEKIYPGKLCRDTIFLSFPSF